MHNLHCYYINYLILHYQDIDDPSLTPITRTLKMPEAHSLAPQNSTNKRRKKEEGRVVTFW